MPEEDPAVAAHDEGEQVRPELWRPSRSAWAGATARSWTAALHRGNSAESIAGRATPGLILHDRVTDTAEGGRRISDSFALDRRGRLLRASRVTLPRPRREDARAFVRSPRRNAFAEKPEPPPTAGDLVAERKTMRLREVAA